MGFADGIVQLVQVAAVPAQVPQVLEQGDTLARIFAIIPVVCYTMRYPSGFLIVMLKEVEARAAAPV